MKLRDLAPIYDRILLVLDQQADDEGLWSEAATIHEAYLQKALRTLHAAIEGEDIRWLD